MMVGSFLVARFAAANLQGNIANKFYTWQEPEEFVEEESNKGQVLNINLVEEITTNKKERE